MGEKACLRMTLKEMLLMLDGINDKICKQSVQQEMMLNADNQIPEGSNQGLSSKNQTAESQIRFIMDMMVSNSHRMDQGSGQIDPDEEQERDRKLQELRSKSNLQLMESIRMDAKMMNLRFNDILSKENNIYLMLAKEREKN